MRLKDLKTLATQHGATGFDYDTAPNGEIDWYQLHYAWQSITPQVRIEPVEFEPVYEMIPTPNVPIAPKRETKPFDNIPDLLRQEERWSVWKRHKDGRKIPYRVLYRSAWSRSEQCRSNMESDWVSFHEALDCFMKSNGHLGGLAFALGDVWCGFDFDDVLVDGTPHPQAKSWLARIGGYQEVSQSRTGIKAIVQARLSKDFLGTAETGRQFKDIPAKGMATEVYHSMRFFFLTGKGTGTPQPNQTEVEKICDELLAWKERLKPKPKPIRTPRLSNQRESVSFSDKAILEKIRFSRQASKFESLWAGNIANYASHSEADMALTSLLMFWCQNDTAQVERLFSQSRLANREKWNREDYRVRTLEKAHRTEVYQPHISKNYKTAATRIKEKLNNG